MEKIFCTPVPSQMMDGMLSTLKECELKILLIILRKTIGFKKQWDWISDKQFVKLTGLCAKSVRKGIKLLIEHQYIARYTQQRKHFYTPTFFNWNNLPATLVQSSKAGGKNVPPTTISGSTVSNCTRGKNSHYHNNTENAKHIGALLPVYN